jgi:hypothetical protein
MSLLRIDKRYTNRLVISFDAFRGNNPAEGYIVKALTIYNITTGGIQTFEFFAPYPWEHLSPSAKYTNTFIKNFIFDRGWYDGHISYDQLPIMLLKYTERASKIYTKGKNCVKFLSNMLGRHVINIEDLMEEIETDALHTITNNVTELYCIHDHKRKRSLAGFSSPNYTCSQNRCWQWGNMVKGILEYKNSVEGLQSI